MNQTTNYGWKKPELNDAADVEIIGSVFEAVDGKTKEIEDKAHTHANKTLLDGITAEKVSAWDNPTTAATYTVSLPASGWMGGGPYTQTVSVAGILADDRPIFGPIYSGTADQKIEQSIMAGFISECDTAAGSVTFTALLAKPEADLTIQMEVIR